MTNFKLYYFDMNGGAGEPIRLAFRHGNIAFEDVRVKFADWPALKPKAKFGQMPFLEVDGEVYAQSMAILRYVGRLVGLYPTDPLEALRVDELLDCFLDVRGKMSTTYALPEAEKIAIRKKLAEEFIKPRLQCLEDRVGKQGYAVGNKLSIADLVIACDIAGMQSGRLDGIEPTIADAHVNLQKICKNVHKA